MTPPVVLVVARKLLLVALEESPARVRLGSLKSAAVTDGSRSLKGSFSGIGFGVRRSFARSRQSRPHSAVEATACAIFYRGRCQEDVTSFREKLRRLSI